MKIRTRLRVVALLPTLFLSLVGVTLWISLWQIDMAGRRATLSREIVQADNDLNLLAQEYLLHGEQRAVRQWQRRHSSLGRLLSALVLESPSERELGAGIKEDNEEIARLFGEIIISPPAPPVADWRQRVVSQFLIASESMRSHAQRLADGYEQRARALQVRTVVMILVLLVALALINVMIETTLTRGLSRSISDLNEGVARVGAGDLQHQIAATTTDELGQLTAGFNAMTSRLRESYAAEIKARQRYRSLFENMTDAYALHEVIFDDEQRPCDYRFLEVNPAFEHLLGLKREAVLGKTVLQILPNTEPYWIETYGQVAATGEGVRFERYESTFDRYFEISATSPEKGLFAVFFSDITERRRADAAMREANEKLAKTLAELRATQRQVIQSEKLAAAGSLAAGVAHELNNPLMGIMGFVTFAGEAAQDPKVKQLLARATHELERMRDLIKNLLGFAQPVGEGALTRVSIPAVLERALSLMRPEFKVRDTTVTTDVTPNLPPVLAEEGRLQQVFLNLLMNARDALEERPRKEIHIAAFCSEDQVVVTVTDTGRGIPPDIQGRIFDPFFTTKPTGKGTGLGLSIARNILADFGGSLTCDSREGEGATFTVALPGPSSSTEEKAPRGEIPHV